jgi:hypothetical protein
VGLTVGGDAENRAKCRHCLSGWGVYVVSKSLKGGIQGDIIQKQRNGV